MDNGFEPEAITWTVEHLTPGFLLYLQCRWKACEQGRHSSSDRCSTALGRRAQPSAHRNAAAALPWAASPTAVCLHLELAGPTLTIEPPRCAVPVAQPRAEAWQRARRARHGGCGRGGGRWMRREWAAPRRMSRAAAESHPCPLPLSISGFTWLGTAGDEEETVKTQSRESKLEIPQSRQRHKQNCN